MRLKYITLKDINILDIGNEIQLFGAIYAGKESLFLVPLPDESPDYLDGVTEAEVLEMSSEGWERFLHQTDVLDIEGPAKAILRKSQRQIDQAIAWEVFMRDGYRCRYCGRRVPLTVDHIILWEEGGASVKENLISACRRCNKLRGNKQYGEWLESEDYRLLSEHISPMEKKLNQEVLLHLDDLRLIKAKPRSR